MGGIGLAFVALFVIIISVFKSKKNTRKTTSNSNKQSKSSSSNKIKTLNRNGEPSNNKENLMNINSNNLDNDDMDEAESIYQKHNHLQQQQQGLICNNNLNLNNLGGPNASGRKTFFKIIKLTNFYLKVMTIKENIISLANS